MAFQMTTKKNLSKNSKDIIFQIAGMANDAIEKVGKENVVNGTFGAILDEEGKLVFLKTVKEEYLSLSDQDHAGYAPIEGLHDFLEAAISECFGQSRPEGYIRALSTSGGTGGVHHLVHNYTRPGDTVLTADWFWAAYRTISEDADRVLDTYTLFNPDNSFNFDSLKEKVLALADKQENVLVIFNTPGNNPTGYSISEADWDRILNLFKSIVDQGKNKIIIGVDVAYLDYSGEKEATRSFFKKFGNLPERILTVVCYSTSTGFTLYGQRVGAMIGITSNEDVAEEFFNENKMTSRGTWSNNTRPAMKVVANIVSDPAKLAAYEKERNEYCQLIEDRASMFMEESKECGLPVLPYSGGFFITIPTDKAKAVCDELFKENIYVIPLAKGVRVAVCGIPKRQVKGLATTMAKAMKTVGAL